MFPNINLLIDNETEITHDYWIVNNIFIFKSNFDEPIDDYVNIMLNYNKLIFSNYDDPFMAIKENNKIENIIISPYSNDNPSKFNQKITIPNNITQVFFGHGFDEIVNLHESITHLIFGYDFNQEVILSNSLTFIFFGYSFNKIITLPESITYLILSDCFDQKIDLPKNLIYLNFGYKFNKIINLPPNLLYLTIPSTFDENIILPQSLITLHIYGSSIARIKTIPNVKYLSICACDQNIIDNLPNSLEELSLNYLFDCKLDNLPNSIKKLVLTCRNHRNCKLNCLPNSIEYLELPSSYDNRILNLPKQLKKIKCPKKYQFIDDFKNYEIDTF